MPWLLHSSPLEHWYLIPTEDSCVMFWLWCGLRNLSRQPKLKPFKTTWKVKQCHVGGATSQAGVVYSLGYCLLFLTTLNFSLCFLLSPPSRPLVILSEHRSARAFFLLGGLFFCPTVAKCFVKRTMRPKSCCRYINKTELKLNWIIMWLIIAFTQNEK